MRPHIMIIDDSADQVSLVLTAMRMVDPKLQVTTASSGDDALKKMRSDANQIPKVILLDVRMPGKSGREVLAELKSDERLRRIPVCMFSSSELDNDVCASYDNGASFYFRKPSGLDDLREFINAFRSLWFGYASHCGSHA